MTDPSTALESFQKAYDSGYIRLKQCTLDTNLYLFKDEAMGSKRCTYVRVENAKIVTAFVMLAWTQPIDGIPCLAIGYAVPEKFRRQGRAKDAVKAALAEIKHELSRAPIKRYCVEAIVERTNEGSKRIAEQLISDEPEAITDEISGLPAFRYLLKIGWGPSSRNS